MDHTGYIYYTSWISLFSSLYGFYRGHVDLALLQGLAFLTSINYWRKPVYGCRRNTDIFAVLTTGGYHSIRALRAENAREFYTYLSFSATCYFLTWYYHYRNNLIISAYLHNCVHIFVFISSMYLYSGSIQKIDLRAPFSNTMYLEN
jgi:hypothetical protein